MVASAPLGDSVFEQVGFQRFTGKTPRKRPTFVCRAAEPRRHFSWMREARSLTAAGRRSAPGYDEAVDQNQAAAALRQLRAEADPRRRRLLALGLLTRQLAEHDIVPILVGGGALEFYTAGGYATTDMDLALPTCKEVGEAFRALGFEREGRYWHHAELDLLFEAPAPAELPGEDAPRTETEIGGLRVVVIGIEDLLINRLRAWVHWRSDEDGRWARRLALLYSDRIDWPYLLERTAKDPAEARAAAQLHREAACP